MVAAVAAGTGGEGGHPPRAALCRGAFGGAKIWNSEILHPNLVYCTVHTNAIVVTIRISIRDLIAGVGAATKTFAPGGKHPRTATG